ncbi:hypothetical protein D3C75_660570 [compost metagenome]
MVALCAHLDLHTRQLRVLRLELRTGTGLRTTHRLIGSPAAQHQDRRVDSGDVITQIAHQHGVHRIGHARAITVAPPTLELRQMLRAAGQGLGGRVVACIEAGLIGRQQAFAQLPGHYPDVLRGGLRVHHRRIERQRIHDHQRTDCIRCLQCQLHRQHASQAVANHSNLRQMLRLQIPQQFIAHRRQEIRRAWVRCRSTGKARQLHQVTLHILQRQTGLAPDLGTAVQAGNHQQRTPLADHLDLHCAWNGGLVDGGGMGRARAKHGHRHADHHQPGQGLHRVPECLEDLHRLLLHRAGGPGMGPAWLRFRCPGCDYGATARQRGERSPARDGRPHTLIAHPS